MNQKVWVIGEEDWKGASDRGRRDDRKNTEDRPPGPVALQKNPALSFSLSMFLWGTGQIYTRDYRQGAVFMVAMVLFHSTIFSVFFFLEPISRFISGKDLSAPMFVVLGSIFFLAGLTLWSANAVHAYYKTILSRTKPFLGVERRFLPPLCSFLFPGWGQFLNGQPGKGLFFLLCGIFGVFSGFSLAVSRHIWPILEFRPGRSIFETVLAVTFFLIIPAFIAWIVSIYDSLRSCGELLRRHRRTQIIGYGAGSGMSLSELIPRGSAVLGLLLAISVGMQLFPREFYLESLERMRVEMQSRHMEVIPRLVQRAEEFIGGKKARPRGAGIPALEGETVQASRAQRQLEPSPPVRQ